MMFRNRRRLHLCSWLVPLLSHTVVQVRLVRYTIFRVARIPARFMCLYVLGLTLAPASAEYILYTPLRLFPSSPLLSRDKVNLTYFSRSPDALYLLDRFYVLSLLPNRRMPAVVRCCGCLYSQDLIFVRICKAVDTLHRRYQFFLLWNGIHPRP